MQFFSFSTYILVCMFSYLNTRSALKPIYRVELENVVFGSTNVKGTAYSPFSSSPLIQFYKVYHILLIYINGEQDLFYFIMKSKDNLLSELRLASKQHVMGEWTRRHGCS